jgi:hypothetical protein
MQKTYVLLGLVLTVVLFVAFFWMSHKPEHPSLEPDMLKRSEQYISQLGQKPLSMLSREEKLLLLHSYFNLGKDRMVVGMGSQMKEDLQALPTDRQKAFVAMITDSYRRLGRDAEAQAFYAQVVDSK